MHLGNSAALETGDIVLAIGNPLGLSSSVSEGIVSFNGRGVGEGNGVFLPDLVQTSAAINPGNSGGALGQPVGPSGRHTDPGRHQWHSRGPRARFCHPIEHGVADRALS